jgi:hypothetical protein
LHFTQIVREKSTCVYELVARNPGLNDLYTFGMSLYF